MDYPDPRQQTIVDLQEFISQRIDQKEEIILSIDVNETINTQKDAPYSITSLITFLDLINITDTLPETLESHKGGRLIDFCLISPNLLSSVEAFGYLPYDQITTTDHRLIFLDLNIKNLFKHKPDAPMTHSSRILKTHLIQRKAKYVQMIQRNFKQQFLLKAAQTLQKEAENRDLGMKHFKNNMMT